MSSHSDFSGFVELWDRHRHHVKRLLHWMVDRSKYEPMGYRDHAVDVEDLVQITYIRAFQAWDDPFKVKNSRAWLIRIARNVFFNHLEQRRTAKRKGELYSLDFPQPNQKSPPDPVDHGQRGDAKILVEELLEGLSRRSQDILRLTLEGHTHMEIGRAMALSPSTIKRELKAIRLDMSQKLSSSETKK